MGLSVNGVQFLLFAKDLGVDFDRTATIGRQGLHLSASDLESSLSRFGYACEEGVIERIFAAESPYADDFLRCLGAREVHSFDNSDYEGATCVHDMNTRIPCEHKCRYSVVFDGGSLEHIFNFPVGLKNCMEMVRVGGHFLAVTPANNFMGHGFYQFSPELYFGAFSRDNGFEVVCVIAHEDTPYADWYAVSSPSSVRARVTLTNCRPVNLLIIARRVEAQEPFRAVLQQSDYLSLWKREDGDLNQSTSLMTQPASHGRWLRLFFLGITPRWIKRRGKELMHIMLQRYTGITGKFDRRFFTPTARFDGRSSAGRVLKWPR